LVERHTPGLYRQGPDFSLAYCIGDCVELNLAWAIKANQHTQILRFSNEATAIAIGPIAPKPSLHPERKSPAPRHGNCTYPETPVTMHPSPVWARIGLASVATVSFRVVVISSQLFSIAAEYSPRRAAWLQRAR
jgi:hypothetical protein